MQPKTALSDYAIVNWTKTSKSIPERFRGRNLTSQTWACTMRNVLSASKQRLVLLLRCLTFSCINNLNLVKKSENHDSQASFCSISKPPTVGESGLAIPYGHPSMIRAMFCRDHGITMTWSWIIDSHFYVFPTHFGLFQSFSGIQFVSILHSKKSCRNFLLRVSEN